MRIFLFFSTLVTAALLLLWQGGETAPPGTAGLMHSVLARAEAQPHQGEALYWGKLAPGVMGQEDLESLALQIARSLGIEPDDFPMAEREETYQMVDLSGKTPSGIQGRIILQEVFPCREQPEGEAFLLVQLKEQGGALKVLEAGERLPRLLHPYSPGGELTLDILAHLPGKMSLPEMADLAEGLLAEAGAERVEGITTDRLVSLTGYTPLLEYHLFSGQEKINFNVALRYDSHREMTLLRLGVPLIGGGY